MMHRSVFPMVRHGIAPWFNKFEVRRDHFYFCSATAQHYCAGATRRVTLGLNCGIMPSGFGRTTNIDTDILKDIRSPGAVILRRN